MNKAQVGKRGERVAARYLRRHGYDILEKNLHISHEEIDIIAVNRQYIVFVEVKTRVMRPENADRYSAPSAAVTYTKQTHLLRAAYAYMAKHGGDQQPRMDVIEVWLVRDGTSHKAKVAKINHIKAAY